MRTKILEITLRACPPVIHDFHMSPFLKFDSLETTAFELEFSPIVREGVVWNGKKKSNGRLSKIRLLNLLVVNRKRP